MSNDWLIVGSPKGQRSGAGTFRNGVVYAYRLTGSQWNPASAEALPLPTEDQYRAGELGATLAIGGDTLVIAAPKVGLRNELAQSFRESGWTYTFMWDGTAQIWQSDATLEMDQPYLTNIGSLFGSTMSVSEDGRWLLMGAPGVDQHVSLDGDNQFDIGRVFIYRVGGLKSPRGG